MTDKWPEQYPTDQEVLSVGPKRNRGRGMALGAAGLAAGLAIGVVGIAGASSTPSPAVGAQPQAVTPALSVAALAAQVPGSTPAKTGDDDHGFGGRRSRGGDMGRAMLHGEFVTTKPGGGYQSVQMQRGAATSVSATSITVKSEDGFTRTYPVTKDTLVNAGRDGITTIAVNDVVHVQAIGTGDSPTAATVMDETKMMANHDRFRPKELKPTA